MNKRYERHQQFEQSQIDWMISCGGTLEGYLAKYGDPDLSFCSGQGGTKIFEADLNALQNCIDIVDQHFHHMSYEVAHFNGYNGPRKAIEVLTSALEKLQVA